METRDCQTPLLHARPLPDSRRPPAHLPTNQLQVLTLGWAGVLVVAELRVPSGQCEGRRGK